MVECPECGKELIHQGALNGHRAFKHGITTEKGLTLKELRNKVTKLTYRVNYMEAILEDNQISKKPTAAIITLVE
jgi:hypothetical protein